MGSQWASCTGLPSVCLCAVCLCTLPFAVCSSGLNGFGRGKQQWAVSRYASDICPLSSFSFSVHLELNSGLYCYYYDYYHYFYCCCSCGYLL